MKSHQDQSTHHTGEHDGVEDPTGATALSPIARDGQTSQAVPLEAIAAYERYCGEVDEALDAGDTEAWTLIREYGNTIEIYEMAELISIPLRSSGSATDHVLP